MRFFLIFFVFLGFFASGQQAKSVETDSVQANLIAEADCISRASPSLTAIKFTIPKGKHTYFKYAGDTGEPTQIALTLPQGFTASDVMWQTPKIFNTAGFYEIGYNDAVYHFIKITPPADFSNLQDSVNIKAQVLWLECGKECISKQADLERDFALCDSNNIGIGKDLPFLQEFTKVITPRQEADIIKDYKALSAGKPSLTASSYTKGELSSLPLYLIILLAFAGGLILNLMPCVLPVVSLKIMGLVKGQEHTVRINALLYAAGVVFTFISVGAIIIALNMAGQSYAWGFQLQNPAFILFLACLLTVLGLMFSGLLHLPLYFVNMGKGKTGAFASGILSVLLASPCVAPFMGTAVAYGLATGGICAACVFLFMGIGLAFPLLVLAFYRGWVKYIPKSGRWNLRLQKLLAIPLYLSAVWLIWVLDKQAGETGLYIALMMQVLLVWSVLQKQKIVYAVTVIAFVIGIITVAAEKPAPQVTFSDTGIAWEKFSLAKLDRLLDEGKPVFVKFGASWCLTCLVNDKIALDNDEIADLFTQYQITPLYADFTLKNDEITAALRKYNRNGVPLYVYYDKRKNDVIVPPVILPNIITKDTVKAYIKGE